MFWYHIIINLSNPGFMANTLTNFYPRGNN